jgi:hypothetical protein
MLPAFLRNLMPRRSPSSAGRRRRDGPVCRPGVEALEDRLQLSTVAGLHPPAVASPVPAPAQVGAPVNPMRASKPWFAGTWREPSGESVWFLYITPSRFSPYQGTYKSEWRRGFTGTGPLVQPPTTGTWDLKFAGSAAGYPYVYLHITYDGSWEQQMVHISMTGQGKADFRIYFPWQAEPKKGSPFLKTP